MQVLYLNEETMKLEIRDIEDNLDVYYNLINCRSIDIPRRKIGGKYFLIICDDEGLLKGRIMTGVNLESEELMLVGSLVIVNSAPEGEVAGLTTEDINIIINQLYRTADENILIDMKY